MSPGTARVAWKLRRESNGLRNRGKERKMTESGTEQPGDALLDNPIWSALATDHRALAVGGAHREIQALRYPEEIGPLSGMPAETEAGWVAMAELAGAGGVVALFFREAPRIPPGWTVVRSGGAGADGGGAADAGGDCGAGGGDAAEADGRGCSSDGGAGDSDRAGAVPAADDGTGDVLRDSRSGADCWRWRASECTCRGSWR